MSDNRASGSVDDIVGSDVEAIGSEVGLMVGCDFHRLKVSFFDGRINVGCTRLSVKAWENIRSKVEQVLAARSRP